MNTEQMEHWQKRLERFKETEIGKAFSAYKEAVFRARKARNDDHYQALQEMMEAEDRLMELTKCKS